MRFVTVPACVRYAGPLRSPYPLATVVHICITAFPRSCLVHARAGFLFVTFCVSVLVITPAVVVWSGQSSPLTHPKQQKNLSDPNGKRGLYTPYS